MKRILTTLSQKWPEYLLEIIVLIIGIYGAFALEEWNENRKTQAAQNALVQNLKFEFTTNLMQLDTVIYNDKLVAKAATHLMNIMTTKKLSF